MLPWRALAYEDVKRSASVSMQCGIEAVGDMQGRVIGEYCVIYPDTTGTELSQGFK